MAACKSKPRVAAVSMTNLLARKQDVEEEEVSNKHCGVQLRVDVWSDLIGGKVQFFQRDILTSGGVPDDTDNWELQYRLPF